MLTLVYEAARNPEQRLKLRTKLERLVGRGETVALAHFSTGAILWFDCHLENAIWHTEKTWEMDPAMVDVANNIAWRESNRELHMDQYNYD